MRRLLLPAVTGLLLTACAMGPNYERPELPVPEGWRDSTAALRDSSYANVLWWDVFQDDTLTALVRTALVQNQDLRVALARVNEARALLGIQRLEFLPQVDVIASARRGAFPDSLLSGTGIGDERNTFTAGIGVSWEIDLWGRLRRLNEASRARLMATEYGRRAAVITVVSEVARTYLELLDLDNQRVIAERQLEVRRQSLALATARFQGGLTSELDIRQGEIALAGAERTLFGNRRLGSQKENEISILLGTTPGDISRGLPLGQQSLPAVVPAGLPSELLLRRPDVQSAEEELRAANAQVGAAIAALFPTISLTAGAGSASDALGGLFSAGTGFWNVAANLLGPVINRGRNLKQVAAERARTEAAVAQYERAVLAAFREVEDGLVEVAQRREETAAASRAASSARRALVLANARYEGGVDDYLTLLDAQRVLLEAELTESELERLTRVAVIRLYKALGGGWDPVTDSLTITPKEPR